jgi:hypothetical protein
MKFFEYYSRSISCLSLGASLAMGFSESFLERSLEPKHVVVHLIEGEHPTTPPRPTCVTKKEIHNQALQSTAYSTSMVA